MFVATVLSFIIYLIFSIGIAKVMQKAWSKETKALDDFIAYMVFWPVIIPIYAFM